MNSVGNGDPMHEVCIPHSNSRMGTVRAKQEVGADTSVIAIE